MKTRIRQEELGGYICPWENLRKKFDMEEPGVRNPSRRFLKGKKIIKFTGLKHLDQSVQGESP